MLDDNCDKGVSKPVYEVLSALTHQQRVDIALPIAMKDWLRLKLKEVDEERLLFEQKYGMDFAEFKRQWHADLIPDRYSYEVESDYWDWEGAVTETQSLVELSETLSTHFMIQDCTNHLTMK